MTVLNTQISCFDTTWNPAVGCSKISEGCDNCYAEAIARRFFGGFEVRLHPERLTETRKFKPLTGPDGFRVPRRVFVNSMGDLWHQEIPDRFIDDVFGAIARHPHTVFVCLTKRAGRMLAYGRRRWKAGVPENIWLGVTAENDAVHGRIDALRRLKAAAGPFTAYVNAEPLLGPISRHDYTDIDWVGVGGEAGARARPCAPDWVRRVIASAHDAGAAVWFKSWGRWENNPNWARARGRTKKARKQDLIARGLELLPEEHGGATLDGALVQELPPGFARLRDRLRRAG
ncbi:MAG: hypothetical protein C0605_01475 [Hyphomicrobiales bacterium]|nr:MAG: hypothetical protein C0605_01475 [Hyphomicrobiales bacterium]